MIPVNSVSVATAIDVLDYSPPKDLYGNDDPSGKFCRNPVPFSFVLAELRGRYFGDGPVPQTSPFYKECLIAPSMIKSCQRLIVKEKVKDIIIGQYFQKPIIVAKFEENGEYLILDGNHRLAAATLLRLPSLLAYVVDCRISFQ